jgi:hypothetical protein
MGTVRAIYVAILMFVLATHIVNGEAPLFLYVLIVGVIVATFYIDAKYPE